MNTALNILTFEWLIADGLPWLGALVPFFWFGVVLFIYCLFRRGETQACHKCSQEFPESTMFFWKTTYKKMWVCKGCWAEVDRKILSERWAHVLGKKWFDS